MIFKDLFYFFKLKSHSLMRIFAFEWVRFPLSFSLFMSFSFSSCIDLFLRLLLFFFSFSSIYLFVILVCCWRQILDEFRFRFCVHLINNPRTYTHRQTVSVFLLFLSFFSLVFFLRVEILTLVETKENTRILLFV